MDPVLVEIWSDVVCPWCFLGERRLEIAIEQFAHGDQIEVAWRAFQLDPRAPAEWVGDQPTRIAQKYGISVEQARAGQARITEMGAEIGLDFEFDLLRTANSFDAHRVIKLAAERGLEMALARWIMGAHFIEGVLISDHDALIHLGSEAGLDPTEVAAVLAADTYAAEVRQDREQAIELGISGVPHFLVDGRFAIPGAQSVETILGVLTRAWSRANPA